MCLEEAQYSIGEIKWFSGEASGYFSIWKSITSFWMLVIKGEAAGIQQSQFKLSFCIRLGSSTQTKLCPILRSRAELSKSVVTLKRDVKSLLQFSTEAI
jgi:hypothetical protein